MKSIVAWLRGAWFDPFQRYLLIALILIAIVMLALKPGRVAEMGGAEISFFFNPNCPHCQEQMGFNEELGEKYNITVLSYDVTTPEGLTVLAGKAEKAGFEPTGVPVTFIGENYFVGFDEEIGQLIEAAVHAMLSGQEIKQQRREFSTIVTLPVLGDVDVKAYSLPVLGILLGLVDGFNPCAMWVLVYLISLLMGVKEKKRIWIIIGTFLIASGALYFLFMAAWLNVFLLLGYVRAITVIIGLAGIWLGANNLRDYLKKKEMVCEVTSPESREKTMRRAGRLLSDPLTVTTIFGIIVLAFIVNSVEFVCSSMLPAIFSQVLALSGLTTLQNYLYIFLYIVFFMLDDLLIFGLAAFAISSSFGEKYARQCKLIGGLLLMVLGLLLTFRPHMLR